MTSTDKTSIESAKLIVVEGNDDENFIHAFLDELHIEGVEIFNIGGNNFKNDIPEIGKIPGFDKINYLAVIGDADESAENTFTKIKSSIEKIEDYEITPPSIKNTFNNNTIKVGIFIVSKSDSNEGMLEDLCLETVKTHKVMQCVNSFSECLSNLGIKQKNPSKSKCQTFLSAMTKSVPNIGIAAKKGYWDLKSEALSELKTFLLNFKS